MKEVRGPDGQFRGAGGADRAGLAELAAYGLLFDPSRAAERVPVELLLDAQGEVVALRPGGAKVMKQTGETFGAAPPWPLVAMGRRA